MWGMLAAGRRWGWRKGGGGLLHVCKYLMGGDSKEDGARFVSVVPREQTRGSGHKLK